jgi:hypothetical protein
MSPTTMVVLILNLLKIGSPSLTRLLQLSHLTLLVSQTSLIPRNACLVSGFKVQEDLINLDGNNSHYRSCWYLTLRYAAGTINEFGPESNGTVSCLFGLSMDSHVESPNKRITALVIVIVSSVPAGLLTLRISFLLWKKTLA